MWCCNVLVVLGCLHSALALWTCSSDLDCSTLVGSQCLEGDCACPAGQQTVLGGSLCVDLAPYYHTSACVEDHQCSRLLTAFECRGVNGTDDGACQCQPNHHYFLGRCWPTADFGQPCIRDEQCLSTLRDPYSLVCDGETQTCVCAGGYYARQNGECRKIGFAVGDGCVLDEDCQFERGLCDADLFECYDSAETRSERALSTPAFQRNVTDRTKIAARQHGIRCSSTELCPEPFECSLYGSCVCPIGYYASDDGTLCLAELGSPAPSADLCVGLLATVVDGTCTCPNNFYFDENMRDCIKATRRITESCVSDANCHTFGAAALCGEPQPPWGFRTCECQPELAVWDDERQLCRLFAGIGETCVADSDCLAGGLEIQCVVSPGQDLGVCTCPEGYIVADGLCLTTGLNLGDACQVSVECTATPNTACENGFCVCDSTGYQEVDGTCAPIIGGICSEDADCVIENTGCFLQSVGTENVTLSRCQCQDGYVEFEDVCWSALASFGDPCEVSVQCIQSMGEASSCVDGACVCEPGFHFRDGGCWRQTDLFEPCSRASECYLGDLSERVVCRNSLCQCDFDYPFSEDEWTCRSSADSFSSSLGLVAASLAYLFLS